jgi:DDE superfamily endonuclease
VLYDAKRHTHTAQGLAISSVAGDLLWVDGGWPGNCHEHELVALSGLDGAPDGVAVSACWIRVPGTGYPHDQASRTPRSHASNDRYDPTTVSCSTVGGWAIHCLRFS